MDKTAIFRFSLRGGTMRDTSVLVSMMNIQINYQEVIEENEGTEQEMVFVENNKSKYLIAKRLFDVIISVVALAILWPLMLLVAIAIKLESPGPVIFSQDRMGKNGEVFTIYKFRTMVVEAPNETPTKSFSNAGQYITRLGKYLRKTSIDELPQLYNILRGDMSIVGYRPVCLTETQLNEMRKNQRVFRLRPGLTGLAQVSGRDSLDIEEKVRLDAKYVQECSFRMDVWCLLKTIAVVITGEGVM